MGLLSYNDWLQQYKNPDYWKYDSLPVPKFNVIGGDPWSSYRDGVPKYTKGLVDYIKYAAPDLVTDAEWKKNTSNAFVSHSASGISDYLYGSPFLESNIQNPLYKNPNTPKEVLAALYPSTSAFLKDDPFVQQLNSQYQYIAPANNEQQNNANREGGSGFDFRTNPYGSWDLGHDNLYLAPKFMRNRGLYIPSEGSTLDPYLNPKYYNPYNEDGSFNPDGWEVRSNKSQALGGVMGTLGVLGAAAGSALWGPAGGATTNLSGSFDGLMTGALQNVGGAGASGGLLGGVSGEWTPINGDAGLNSYVNGGINTNYNNFGLGALDGISGDASLNAYTGNVLNGVNIGDGTYSGVPDADTSWNSPSSNNSDLLKNAGKLLNKGGNQGSGGMGGMGQGGGQTKSIESSSPYNTPIRSDPVAYAAYLKNKGLLG